MKKLMIVLLLSLFVVVQMRCGKRSNRAFSNHFWTSKKTEGKLFLYVDDNYKGVIPYLPEAPSWSDDNLKEKTLPLRMPSGDYKIAVKDEQNHVRIEQLLTLKLSNNNTTISSKSENDMGAIKSVLHNDCLIEELYF